MPKPRPALFKWRHFEPGIIVCAVRRYLRFSLFYRDVEELLVERDLPADHTAIWRWVQRYAPELNNRCRQELKPANGSWTVDETYVCQGGNWRLYPCCGFHWRYDRLLVSAESGTRLRLNISSKKPCRLPAIPDRE